MMEQQVYPAKTEYGVNNPQQNPWPDQQTVQEDPVALDMLKSYMGKMKLVSFAQIILGVLGLGCGIATLVLVSPVWKFPITSGMPIVASILAIAGGGYGIHTLTSGLQISLNNGLLKSKLWTWANICNGAIACGAMNFAWSTWAAIECSMVESMFEKSPMCWVFEKNEVTATCAVSAAIGFFIVMCDLFAMSYMCCWAKRMGMVPRNTTCQI